MGIIDTASQVSLFDGLLTFKQLVVLPDTLTIPPKSDKHKKIKHIVRKDPLLNRRIVVPVFPSNVLRADVDKNDLIYNLRRMND